MIRIEHLVKIYDNSLKVLDDVNAVIEDGEVISIIGPSGTGKSTLLRCINGLEPSTSGHIWIDDVDVTASGVDLNSIRRKVGMVFQNFNLFDHLSVLDNLMIGPIKLLGMSREEAEKQGRSLLSQVGLSSKAEAFPSELSGGQQQRAAIARCLSMNSKVILFDEPTSSLDPTMITEVLSVIRNIARRGITMLIVTHEMQFARDVSSRVFYLDQGIIYEQGTPQQIFENPRNALTKVFMGRIRAYDFQIEDNNYDSIEMLAGLDAFCTKYALSKKYYEKIEILIANTLSLCFANYPDSGNIRLRVTFSEVKGEIKVKFRTSAQQKSFICPQIQSPELELIRRNCDDINERVEDNYLKLTLTLR